MWNNKEHHKRYMREVWYPKNRTKHLKRVQASKDKRGRRVRSLLDRIKIEVGCADCGYDKDPVALDFDHLRDKSFTISHVLKSRSEIEILKETEKCDIVCANCHRIRTRNRRQNSLVGKALVS